MLGVCSREPGRFDESDLRLLEAFASLASLALRNAEAFEEQHAAGAGRARLLPDRRGAQRAAVARRRRSTRSPRPRPRRSAATRPPCCRAGRRRARAGRRLRARRRASPTSYAGGAAALAACARGGKRARVAPARRRRPLRRRAGRGRGGRRPALAARGPAARSRRASGRARARLLRGERAFDDDELELAAQVAAPRAARSSGASSTSASGAARALAQRLARAGRELAGELDPDNVLDEVVGSAVQLLGVDGASVRLLEGDELVVRAAVGRRRGRGARRAHARRPAWLVGDIVQSRATPARSTTSGRRRARRRGRPDARRRLRAPTSACRCSGPEESVHGDPRRLRRRARAPGARRRSRRCTRSRATRRRARERRALPGRQRTSSSAARRSSPTSPTASSPSTATARSCSGTRPPSASPASRRRTRSARRRPRCSAARSSRAGRRAAAGCVPIRRGGEEVWLSLSEAVMTDPAGAVAGRIYAFRDISAERSVEQMKSDFVSTVSHELRTPLTSIYGFAETLLRQDVLFGEEERRDVPPLHRLRVRAADGDRRPAALGRAARHGRHRGAARRRPTSARSSARRCARPRRADGQNGHRFVVDARRRAARGRGRPRQAPPGARASARQRGPLLARRRHGHRRRTPPRRRRRGQRRGRGRRHPARRAGADLPQVLPRRRGAAGAVGAGATGLGLFLAEGLVAAMGGRIWVDSDEGRGSTFVFELPRRGD